MKIKEKHKDLKKKVNLAEKKKKSKKGTEKLARLKNT